MCKHIILIILVSTSFSFEAEQKVSDNVLLPKYFLRWSLGKYFQKQFSAVQRKDVIFPYPIFDLDTESRDSSKSKEISEEEIEKKEKQERKILTRTPHMLI